MPENISGPGRKYAALDLAGKAAFREGPIQEFPGFPESLDNRFNVSVRFTPGSEMLFRERVGVPIAKIGESLGIKFILAGRDFTLHSTILEGLYEGSDIAEREEKFKALRSTPKIQQLKDLVGETVTYKYLLIDKGNLLLTAIDIPEWTLATREALKEIYSNEGLKPLVITDFLHISVARITNLPDQDRKAKLQEYKKQMIKLRHQVSSNPLELKVGEVSVGSPLKLLRSA